MEVRKVEILLYIHVFILIVEFLFSTCFYYFTVNSVVVSSLLYRPPGKLCFIDHVVGNQPEDAMVSIAEWYVHFTLLKLNVSMSFVTGSRREKWIRERHHYGLSQLHCSIF